MEVFNSNNLLIIWYPQYAGGKFIMNCLSLSRHAIPLHAAAGDYLLQNPTDYDYRLNFVLKTLPDSENMKEWLQYECNTFLFYDQPPGTLHIDISKTTAELEIFTMLFSNPSIEIKIAKVLKECISKNINFFAESLTTMEIMKKYLTIWPNARIIVFTNFNKFREIACKRKAPDNFNMFENCGNEQEYKYNQIKGDLWPLWQEFEKNLYDIESLAQQTYISDNIKNEIKLYYNWHNIKNDKFRIDIDNTFFNVDKFLETIKNLYQWLKYDDFNEKLLLTYYRKYINLHT